MEDLYDEKFYSLEIKSGYLKSWLKLLCNNESRYKKFMNSFFDKGNIFHSACSYQRYLREVEGRGRDIEIDCIHEAVIKCELRKLQMMFEEIFIEPIDYEAIACFVNLFEQKKFPIYDFINLHNEDYDRCFWQVLKKLMQKEID